MTKQKVRMCMEYASAVVLAVCTGGTVAGAGNVRVVDCKGREFAAPTCMTEERIFKVADKEFTNGGVKVLGLDSRITRNKLLTVGRLPYFSLPRIRAMSLS